MLITKIEKQKNSNKRYSVFIDNEFAFGIEEIDLIYYKLQENQTITKEKLDDIINNNLFEKAKNTALHYLGYKMRTESQIIKKLKEKDFSNDIIIKVINLLKKYNYINDYEFAKAFLKDKSQITKHGSLKIKSELKLLGVEDNIIKSAFEKTSYNEESIAIELLEKKTFREKFDFSSFKEKQKLISYLVRRGFTYDIAKEALEKFISN